MIQRYFKVLPIFATCLCSIILIMPNVTFAAAIGYWKINENAGNVVYDSSGLNNNGTVYNGTWFSDDFGVSLGFNGTSFVEILDSVNLDVGQDYSVSLWVNPGVLPTWQCLFERGISADNRMGIWLNGDRITFETSNNGGNWWSTSSTVTLNQWHHIAVTHDGASDTENVYVNGNLIGSQAGRTVDTPNLGSLYIGYSPAYSGYNFNGKIGDVRFFDTSLNDIEIFELFTGAPPVCTDNDADGFNSELSLCGPMDCNDTDPSINPSAVEIACDGIDQDCSGQDYCPGDPGSPQAYFLFDSDANDSSGNDNNGIVVGAEIYAPGQIGNSLTFDGNSHVDVLSSVNLDVGENYSISLWANPGSLSTWQCLFERGTSADNRMGIWLNGDRITFETSNNGGNWWTTPSVVVTNQWHHIVATHDGASDLENVYVNGTLIGSQTGRTVDSPNLGNLNIGSSPAYSSGYHFSGNMDDVRYYNKTLSQTDVDDLFAFTQSCTDIDGDGYNSEPSLCGPVDCNDLDASVHPGAIEVCDGIDNNCVAGVDENLTFDSDGDGYTTLGSCSGSANDCDDSNALVNPGATEVCNGIDDNCIAGIDEAGSELATWYADIDSDLFGNPNVSLALCSQPFGYVANNLDCDDGNQLVYTGAPEICDGLDNNCDTVIDEGITFDLDEDGYTSISSCGGTGNDCDDSNFSINPGAIEICDGLDNNCNTGIDEGLTFDLDADGYSSLASCGGSVNDCNDLNPAIHIGAVEIACDGIDQDCSGQDYCPSDPSIPLTYFLFDSDVNDSSGNGNNGSVVGTEIYAVGQIGSSLSFDGNSYVDVPSSVNLDVGENYSISLWANPGSLPTWQCLFERGISANNRMGIWLNGDMITFETSNNGGNWWTTPSVVAVNQWHHIVATHVGATDTENIYVDGSLVASQTGRIVDSPNLGNLNIGSSPAYSSGYNFSGNMDDVRFFNKELSQADVSDLYLTCNNLDTRSCGLSDVGVCSFGAQSCVDSQWGQCVGNIDPVIEMCGDGLDNDCDAKSDCDDSDCFEELSCANPYQISFVSPTPVDGSIQQESSVTVNAALTGTNKYSFIDWNDGVHLWLTMDTDINGELLDSSSKNRRIETKGNVSQITGKFGNAMRFDGYEDYLQIYEETDQTNSITKYVNNPVLGSGRRFGSVWKYGQTIYLFYSNGSEVYVSSSPESDGLNFSNETRVLQAGPSGNYDDVITGANVWEENDTWHMLYRTRYSDTNHGFAYAYCSVGINCVTGSGSWVKHSANPINSVDGLENNDYDPFGIIKVGNTYHLYANPSPRVINHYTSTDLVNWQSDANNPIFNTDRYCPYVFKRGAYFYMLLPHDQQGFDYESGIVGDHTFELYRDASPDFSPLTREYLGVVMSNDELYDRVYIDTPSCILDNIERDASSVTEPLQCYYTGSTGNWNQNQMTMDLTKFDSLPVQPEGFLHGVQRTVSGWIYLEDNQTPRSIFSIADGRIDSNFQEVFRVLQGRPAISWKTGASSEDMLMGNTTIPLNEWTHVSYVYNGSSFKIYVNGISDSLWKVGTPYYQKRNLYLGSGYSPTNYFLGGIDDALIFDRVLSDDEIFALYNASANLIGQFNSLVNDTYTYQAHTVGWEGRKASSVKRQITVSAP